MKPACKIHIYSVRWSPSRPRLWYVGCLPCGWEPMDLRMHTDGVMRYARVTHADALAHLKERYQP
jgi:hypothetical protein